MFMNNLNNYKFSKIGTNPMKYFDNFYKYINNIPIGNQINIKDFKIIHQDVEIMKFNSYATIIQNIDCWIWMGLFVKISDKSFLKIIKENLSKHELLEYIKYFLLIDSDEKKINQHRKTIITKLLTIKNNKSMNNNYSYEEIIKECGQFEKKLIEDEIFMKILQIKWGNTNNDK